MERVPSSMTREPPSPWMELSTEGYGVLLSPSFGGAFTHWPIPDPVESDITLNHMLHNA